MLLPERRPRLLARAPALPRSALLPEERPPGATAWPLAAVPVPKRIYTLQDLPGHRRGEARAYEYF